MKAPIGLLLLAAYQVIAASYGVWTLVYHQGIKWDSSFVFDLLFALCFGAAGMGLSKVKTWAYRTSIIIYLFDVILYLGRVMLGHVPSGLTPSKYQSDNIKLGIYCSVLLACLIYYRKLLPRMTSTFKTANKPLIRIGQKARLPVSFPFGTFGK